MLREIIEAAAAGEGGAAIQQWFYFPPLLATVHGRTCGTVRNERKGMDDFRQRKAVGQGDSEG